MLHFRMPSLGRIVAVALISVSHLPYSSAVAFDANSPDSIKSAAKAVAVEMMGQCKSPEALVVEH